ncbi:uncharacterized protein V1516DRAFT_682441 [Lipomyces oligophaga]|uniref:uncharacterized protein n=1 Tax=Lipomyces oligophaga TaxID=45792 RepID=UPI0034CEF371
MAKPLQTRIDFQKLYRSVLRPLRTLTIPAAFTKLTRSSRSGLVFLFFIIFILIVTISSSSGRNSASPYALPGDLDPPFLQTASRRCPAHLASMPRHVLSSVSNPFLSAMRINFNAPGTASSTSKDAVNYRFNPSLLPMPSSAPYSYMAFSSQLKGSVYELWYCYIDRGQKRISRRVGFQCATEPTLLNIPTLELGECNDHPFLALKSGPQTPRVLLMPDGTPVLMYSANSQSYCIGVWMIDLRALIPTLVQHFPNAPFQFLETIELNRPGQRAEIEQNWVLMFEKNKTFIQQDLHPRTFSSIGWQNKNLAPRSFSCIEALTEGKSSAVLQQATNTLRLSLCEFPCTATLENTVLISIIHVKYLEGYSPYYERRVLMTSATFPFDVIGISPPLLYAGTDENDMIYTTMIAWDSTQGDRAKRDDIFSRNLDKYKVRKPNTGVEEDEQSGSTEEAGSMEEENASEQQKTAAAEEKVKVDKRDGNKSQIKLEKRISPRTKKRILDLKEQYEDKAKAAEYVADAPELAGLESDFYHGYLNDIVLIGFGIDDRESAMLDVRASELVSCVKKCSK